MSYCSVIGRKAIFFSKSFFGKGFFVSLVFCKSILITTDELISILNKRWGVPKSTVKRLLHELGINSEFEIFADGIKRSYKAVAIEDFLVSVYEHRPIFSTDVFG